MSIITETLNRLETDTPSTVENSGKANAPRLAGKSTGFPVKALPTAILAVFVGTGLMVWHWSDWLDGFDGIPLALADTVNQVIPDRKSDPQLSVKMAQEQAQSKPQPTIQISAASISSDQPAIPSPPKMVATLPETVKPDRQANGNSHGVQTQPGTEPVTLANLTPDSVKTQTAKPKPELKVSVKQQQTEPDVALANSPQTAQDEKSTQPLTSVSIVEAVSPKPKLAAQKSERTRSTEQPHDSSKSRSTATVAKTGNPDIQENGNALQSKIDKKTLTVAKANVKSKIVKKTAKKPKSAVAVASKKRKKTPTVASDKKAQSTQPKLVDEAIGKAQLAVSRGQYQQALAALDKLSSVPERRADFWLMKGSAHLGLGQLELAEEAFTFAQPLAPGNAQIVVQLAILKQEKGDHTSALQILEDAAIRHPSVPEVFLNKGYSQQELGAVRDAGHSFRIFLRMTEGRSLYAEQRKVVNEWLAQL